ncbi:hypothetical protein B0H63DRAFT_517419 [Podospora didyma]|uniref:Bacteriophage T5 Orf172 DNA-binding domain-containing protein n=1 Tax=Podospora didyma TaxID=330526 RepID=A0AAE0U8D7_9PEZI|nr:hypothetical protein B0H63DRAFT_517419 [Podospora didyma]
MSFSQTSSFQPISDDAALKRSGRKRSPTPFIGILNSNISSSDENVPNPDTLSGFTPSNSLEGSETIPVDISSDEDHPTSENLARARSRISANSAEKRDLGTSTSHRAAANSSTTPQRSISDPTPIRNKDALYSGETGANVERWIQAPLDLKDTEGKTGVVYVMCGIRNGRHVVKIGHTTQTSADDRSRQIGSQCKEIEFKPRMKDMRIKSYYKRVEQLAHAELRDFLHKFDDCSCRVKHREWFEIDEMTARRTVHRWIRFCNKKPWTARGDLKAKWVDRLGQHHWQQPPPVRTTTNLEHEQRRHELWERFVDASVWDWIFYDWFLFVSDVPAYRPQICCLVLLGCCIYHLSFYMKPVAPIVLYMVWLPDSSTVDDLWNRFLNRLSGENRRLALPEEIPQPVIKYSGVDKLGWLWRRLKRELQAEKEIWALPQQPVSHSSDDPIASCKVPGAFYIDPRDSLDV